MKKITMLVAILLCAIASQARADDQNHADRYSNADLRGSYSLAASGTSGSAASAASRRTTYDGRGNAEGVIRVSTDGTVAPRLDWSGTYKVDPVTCTATKVANIPGFPPVQFFVTFADGFRELRFIATNPTATISGTARKQ